MNTMSRLAGLAASLILPASVLSCSAAPRPAPAAPLPARSAAAALPGGVWGARLLAKAPVIGLAPGRTSLYATVVGGTLVLQIVRIDPATGSVLNRVGYPGQTVPPVVAGGLVWALRDGPPLLGMDPATLKTVASIPVPVAGIVPVPPAAVVAGPDGTLYVAAGYAFAVIRPGAAHPVRRVIRASGIVDTLAVSPGGTRLYAGFPHGAPIEYSTRTFAVLAMLGPASVVGEPAVASSGGVWGTGPRGVFFAPAGAVSRAVAIGVGGSGAQVGLMTVIHGAVWFATPGTIGCADPVSGRVRVKTAIPADHGQQVSIEDVVYLGAHAYAIYDDPFTKVHGLVTVHPPAACFR